MSLWEDMDHLYTAACDISRGINALGAMAMGLESVHDPYAEGFSALYNYLFDADQELRKRLTACMETV